MSIIYSILTFNSNINIILSNMSLEELYIKNNEKYFKSEREELMTFLPENFNTILDIGCSEGDFLMAIKDKFPKTEAWGLDPFADPLEETKLKLKKFIKSNIEDAIPDLPEQYFDIIFMNDVIEHLVNPEDVLLKIKSKLSPNGFLITSIPNIRYIRNLKHMLWNKDFEYEDFGIRDKTHLRFYTQKSIIKMFNRLNFDIIEMQGINAHHKQKLINILSFGTQEDTAFLQFCTKVQNKKELN
jgi:2-polyprenyl-3-methyl-5-hydroxy-6-metoxy-1,4-benzoquinol methylase